MGVTDDLAARILLAIEETERIARAAGSGTWSWTQGHGDMCNDSECPFGQLMSEGPGGSALLMEVHGYDVADGWQGAPHIVRQDPAASLRRCAADRRLIDIAFQHAAKIDGEWGCVHSADDIRGGRCPEQRPGELDIIVTLADGYGISYDAP